MGEDDIDRAFWRRQTQVANVLNLGIAALDLIYALGTWSTGSNRPWLVGMNALALVGMARGMRTMASLRLAEGPQRDAAFGIWTLSGSLLVTVGCALDGGLASPMIWLLPVSTMLTAMVHRAGLVLASAAAGLAGYLVLAVGGGELTDAPWHTLLPAGYLIALGYAGAMNARFRWGQYDQQVALRRALAALADRDGLTGLLNHRAFRERLREELAGAERHERPLTVLMIDLDHFKTINDEHGHPVGDEVLVATARAIESILRDGDVTARIGGEEFCVALPDTDAPGGMVIAERLRRAISAGPHPRSVTASVGLSCFPQDGTTPGALLDRADRALYVAKRSGRNQVRSTIGQVRATVEHPGDVVSGGAVSGRSPEAR